MARNEQIIRQLRILEILEQSRYGRTLTELRDELVSALGLSELSERTVRRDCESLQASGFDLDSHRTERGTVWKLSVNFRSRPKIETSVTELVALAVGRQLLTPLAGTPYWQGIETLWGKFRQSLPETVWKHFESHWKGLVVRGLVQKSYEEKEGILSTLHRAIRDHRVVQAEYTSSDSRRARTRWIEPHAIVVYRGSLYLLGPEQIRERPPKDADHDTGQSEEEPVRTWKLDRFRRADTLDERFQPRVNFDPEAHFSNSLGIFRAGQPISLTLRFDLDVAAWVEESPWHPSQKVLSREERHLIVSLDNVYEAEIIPKILALGGKVTVVEPESLRSAVLAAAQKILDQQSGVNGP